MSDYVVKTASLIQASGDLKRISDKVQDIADEARSAINQTRSSISSKLVQSGKSAVIHSSISLCSSDMTRLSQALEKASNIYSNCEVTVIDKSKVPVKELEAKDTNLPDYCVEDDSDNNKFIVDLLGKAGLLGSAISVADNGVKAIKSGKWSDVLKLVKSGYKAFDKYSKTYKNIKLFKNFKPSEGTIKAIWKNKFLGLDDYFKASGITVSKAKSFSTRWYNNFQKIKDSELKGLTKKTAIVGTAISAIVNGISNYEEWERGEISGARAWVETATETAVDVGVGAAIGIGVGTAIATVCGGAPVIAVAAGTMLVSAGLDKATNALTGGEYDSFTEFASDKIIDGVEFVADKAVDVYNKAKDSAVNCYKKAKEGLSAGWKKIFG